MTVISALYFPFMCGMGTGGCYMVIKGVIAGTNFKPCLNEAADILTALLTFGN